MANPFLTPSAHQAQPSDRRVAATSQAHMGRDTARLAGKDVFFGGMGLGPDYDWPNPTLRRPSASWNYQSFSQSVQRQLIGKDKFFGGAGQGPDYDYPNPRIAPFPRANLTHIQAITQTVPAPFVVQATANPILARTAVPNLTHAQPIALNLIGKDRFFAAAGEATRYDYPNPAGPVLRQQPDTHAWPIHLYNVPPVAQSVGTNPATARGVQPQQGGSLTLFAVIRPFGQAAWPNPLAPRKITMDVGQRSFLLATQGTPFAQRHWPNPPALMARRYDPSRLTLATGRTQRGRSQLLLGMI